MSTLPFQTGMPNGKLLFCPLMCPLGCSSCTILFLKSYSCWPLPTPTLLPHPVIEWTPFPVWLCGWLPSTSASVKTSRSADLTWQQHSPESTGEGNHFTSWWGKTVILRSTGLLICLSKGRCRVRCFREFSSLIDVNCGVILARNRLVFFGQSWVDQCVVGRTYFKDSLYDTKQLLIQLH